MSFTKSAQSSSSIHSEIAVNVSDYVLTPLSCASIINEIIKNLLYQRSQIPYPYSWLKNIVNKKRDVASDEGCSKKVTNFAVKKHFQTVSSTFDNVEGIMSDIREDFIYFNNNIREIVFVCGVTPVSPKEVYTVKINELARGHREQNHLLENNKKMPNTLRNIFFSETWMDLVDTKLNCTNTYVYIKLNGRHRLSKENIFLPTKPFILPPKVKHVVINLHYSNNELDSCCDNITVFSENCDIQIPTERTEYVNSGVEENSPEFWLQSKILVQGFKECFINKVSASQLW